MEAMYQKFHDRVEFRLVYIKEAHAADSNWSVPYAEQLGIKQHTSYGERCKVASKLLDDKRLSIPCLVDVMQDSVNVAYSAFPDRLFVVRRDGRLAVAADRGPRGFKPALKQTKAWLEEYAETGREPDLPSKAAAPGKERDVTTRPPKRIPQLDRVRPQK